MGIIKSHKATVRTVCGNCGRPWDGFANDCPGHMTDGRVHAVLPPRPDEVGPLLCQNPLPRTTSDSLVGRKVMVRTRGGSALAYNGAFGIVDRSARRETFGDYWVVFPDRSIAWFYANELEPIEEDEG